MPVATPTFGNGKRNAGVSLNNVASGSVSRPLRTTPARSVGTKASWIWMSWEPVPRRPTVSQVSRISTSAAGTRQKHNGRGLGPSTVAPTTISSAAGPPVTNGQRPLRRQPPSAGRTRPSAAPGPGHDHCRRRRTDRAHRVGGDVAGGDLDLLVEGHDRPAGRAVHAGHRLDQLHERQAGGLLAAVVAGRQDAQQPVLGERPHHRLSRPAQLLGRGGVVPHQLRQLARPLGGRRRPR